MENTCKNRDYAITFGKHRGKTLGLIAKKDPGYIVWIFKKNLFWIDSALVMSCQEEVANRWDDLQDAAAAYNHEDWGCRD